MTPKTKTIFRNFHLVRQTYEDSQPEEGETDNTDSDNPKDNQTHRYKKVSISHDMTATQRKDLKRLQNEAKAQEEKWQENTASGSEDRPGPWKSSSLQHNK